jgi:hypothetical protein
MTSKLLLQIAICLLGIIPVATGVPSIFAGLPSDAARAMKDDGFLENEYRYRSAIWASTSAIAYLIVIPHVDTETKAFQWLMGAVFFGGLTRLWTLWRGKHPLLPRLIPPLVVELFGAPLMVLWQMSVAQH